MAKIIGFEKGAYAKRAGLKVGDNVISICSNPINDILDYIYYDCEEQVSIAYINRHGKKKIVNINKPVEKSLGICFDESMELSPKRCKNKCIFCFVDQLPKGMRDTLYVKDDDYRLSFISGNYVTLTNLSESDIERIVKMKISPLYISVHATDNDIRKQMVTNPNTLKLMDYIKYFADNGIKMHTQIVLCEGINDGQILTDSIETLYKFYPTVESLAIVPVGLTCHREGLKQIKPLSEKCINNTIDTVEKFNKGKDFCWCSDEFYVRANREIPPYDYYGNFSQIENGVGLIATFRQNIENSLKGLDIVDMKGKRIAFITGVSFYDELNRAIEKIKPFTKNLEIKVFKIKNKFFGETITVSGLIVGRDILEQVERGFDEYIVPKNMLKEFEDVFLDGITLNEITNELGKVSVVSSLGENLVSIITGRDYVE